MQHLQRSARCLTSSASHRWRANVTHPPNSSDSSFWRSRAENKDFFNLARFLVGLLNSPSTSTSTSRTSRTTPAPSVVAGIFWARFIYLFTEQGTKTANRKNIAMLQFKGKILKSYKSVTKFQNATKNSAILLRKGAFSITEPSRNRFQGHYKVFI